MKQKLTTGTSARAKEETIARIDQGLSDDGGPIIDVATDGSATVREEEQPTPDRSPARQKNGQRDEEQGGRDMPGAEEIAGAGAEEDTFD